jgi:hypothetical protein
MSFKYLYSLHDAARPHYIRVPRALERARRDRCEARIAFQSAVIGAAWRSHVEVPSWHRPRSSCLFNTAALLCEAIAVADAGGDRSPICSGGSSPAVGSSTPRARARRARARSVRRSSPRCCRAALVRPWSADAERRFRIFDARRAHEDSSTRRFPQRCRGSGGRAQRQRENPPKRDDVKGTADAVEQGGCRGEIGRQVSFSDVDRIAWRNTSGRWKRPTRRLSCQ